jgi:hypothetical protein
VGAALESVQDVSRRVSACPVLAHTASDLLVSAVEVQVAVGQLWTLHHANMEGTKHVQSEVLAHQYTHSRPHTTGTLVFTAPCTSCRHTPHSSRPVWLQYAHGIVVLLGRWFYSGVSVPWTPLTPRWLP